MGLPDRALWRQSRVTDLADDEAARYLDLAGFADGRLDADDRERVAAWLACDPDAAADIAAVRTLADMATPPPTAPAAVVARACALVGEAESASNIIAFALIRRASPRLRGMTRWGSLVTAVAMASWLGFSLGIDTSRAFVASGQPGEEGFLNELLDTPTGLVGDLTEGSQT